MPPKMYESNAERQRRYRERLKEKGKYEEHQKRKNDRQKQKRACLSATGLKAVRTNERKRKWRSRARAKGRDEDLLQQSLHPGFSPQSLGKAVQRAKRNLPDNLCRRRKVIEELAETYGVGCEERIRRNRVQQKKISEETYKAINDFYCRDDISWQSANRKDAIIQKDSNGQKTYIQKRFLVLTLKECHALYLEEHPEFAVSLSTFCSLRPPQVFLCKDFPHNVCVCRHHENVRLLLECLSKLVPAKEVPVHFKKFIATVVCDQKAEKCMTGKCAECSQKFDERYKFPEEQNGMSAEWYQWQSVDGRWMKVQQSGTVRDVLTELKQQLPGFLLHTYIKRKQSAHFEKQKQKADGKHIVVQVDFAENYSIVQQDEIQSGHWAHDQVTLFTACAQIDSSNVKSYVIVSDDLVHGKFQVATFLDKIIKDVKTDWQDVESASFFPDGTASQFKQRFLLHNITYYEEDYNLKVNWNFLATSHGKGAVDGIGGHVKRLVWNSTRTGAFVKDAQSFASEAAKRVHASKVIYDGHDEVEDGMRPSLCHAHMLLTLWYLSRSMSSAMPCMHLVPTSRPTLSYQAPPSKDLPLPSSIQAPNLPE